MTHTPDPAADELIAAVRPLVDRIGGRLIDPTEVADGDVALSFRGDVFTAVRLAARPAGTAAGGDTGSAVDGRNERGEPEPRPDEGGLAGILADVQREFAEPLHELPRPDKQRAVRLLEEAGAFSYRKSVESVASALGVSRFTVYNYLNRDRT
ncbi:helix-turn-helix domain-containing protein [Nakamurella sp.]|uniref:helix-turn-helix domain-containing protein n=1 Tax=Nakamurella sp. TaxID=1869182 RepID=UPI003B3B5821